MSSTQLPPEAVEMVAAADTLRLATAAPDGRPFVTPFWFAFDGERFAVDSLENRTVRNVRRNPRCAVVIDAGSSYADLRGVTVEGTAAAYAPEEAPAAVAALIEEIRRRHADEIASQTFAELSATETRPAVFVEIVPERVRWWDYARRRV